MKFFNWFYGGEKNPPERAGYIPKEMDESWKTHPSSPFSEFLSGYPSVLPQSAPADPGKPPKMPDLPECP